jgi:hypothetical protein
MIPSINFPNLLSRQFDRRLVANIQALIPDPEFTNSNSDNTTATLRLTYQGGLLSAQRDYKIEREQSSKSVIGGFALLGGAWTFISGLFATVFGCKLLAILFGKEFFCFRWGYTITNS